MVTMGSVWDRTTEVVAGRGGMLAATALPTIFLPAVVRDAWTAYATPGTASFSIVALILSLLMLVATIFGQLAVIAVASDPATDRGAAFRIAAGRLLPAIGVSLVMGIALAVAAVPLLALLVGGGVDFTALIAGRSITPGQLSGGLLAGAFFYGLIWLLVLAWLGARLAVWQPVLVNERNGLAALTRSWRLTAGSAWRIIGVLILYVVVLAVAVSAAQYVTGTIFRLILGAGNIATAVFLAGVVATVVSTLLAVLAIVFLTRLYAVLAESKPAAP